MGPDGDLPDIVSGVSPVGRHKTRPAGGVDLSGHPRRPQRVQSLAHRPLFRSTLVAAGRRYPAGNVLNAEARTCAHLPVAALPSS